MKILARFLIAALLMTDVMAAAQHGTAKALGAETRVQGTLPFLDSLPPPAYESWYATAVIEVDTPVIIGSAPVSDFRLIYKGGQIKASRIVLIEVILPRPAEDTRALDTGDEKYWLRSSAVSLWDGHLPVGKTRLRIRAAFTDGELRKESTSKIEEFRVKVGPWTVNGKIRFRFGNM